MRRGLGRIKGHDKNYLTLHELGELIRRAGKRAGFIPKSEYQVKIPNNDYKKKIDWVWLDDKGGPIVAFEIEGPDAYPNSVKNDVQKFRACKAKINVIALYKINHNHALKRNPPKGESPKNWIKKNAGRYAKNIDIYFDYELMKKGGIETIIKDATSAS